MADYIISQEQRQVETTQMLCDWIYNTQALHEEMQGIAEESKRLRIDINADRRWHGRLLKVLSKACEQMTAAGLNVPDHNTNCYWIPVLKYYDGDAGYWEPENFKRSFTQH